jgi:hypothetical protein
MKKYNITFWDGSPQSPYTIQMAAKTPFAAINKARKQEIGFEKSTRFEIIQVN